MNRLVNATGHSEIMPVFTQREVEVLMFLSAIVMMKNRRASEYIFCIWWKFVFSHFFLSTVARKLF